MTATIDAGVPVIDLVHPMPGFPDDRHFALVDLDGSGGLCSMRSLEHPDLRFLVAPPGLFFPDYAPEINDQTVAELDIDSADEVMVLVVILQDAEHSVSVPLVAAG